MSGIWDITHVSGEEGQERLSVHLMQACVRGVAFGVITGAQAKSAVESELGRSLTTEEATDFSGIGTNASTGNTEDKIVYCQKLDFAMLGAENNVIDETVFRSVLGIS